jgi:hypothetical protein
MESLPSTWLYIILGTTLPVDASALTEAIDIRGATSVSRRSADRM